jgi:predicted small secreted protein
MNKTLVTIVVLLMIITAGCQGMDVQGDDYQDAPKDIQDGSLDYQDYKEADCPYLEGSLDQDTMKKCNKWIRNNSN